MEVFEVVSGRANLNADRVAASLETEEIFHPPDGDDFFGCLDGDKGLNEMIGRLLIERDLPVFPVRGFQQDEVWVLLPAEAE